MRKRSLLKVGTLLEMRGFNWKEVESVFLSEEKGGVIDSEGETQ